MEQSFKDRALEISSALLVDKLLRSCLSQLGLRDRVCCVDGVSFLSLNWLLSRFYKTMTTDIPSTSSSSALSQAVANNRPIVMPEAFLAAENEEWDSWL